MLGAQDTIGCLARVIFFKTRRLEFESSFQRTKLDLVRKKACKDISSGNNYASTSRGWKEVTPPHVFLSWDGDQGYIIETTKGAKLL